MPSRGGRGPFDALQSPSPPHPHAASVSWSPCQRRVGMQLLSLSGKRGSSPDDSTLTPGVGGWEESGMSAEQVSPAPLGPSPAASFPPPQLGLGPLPPLTDNDAQVLEAGEGVLAGVQHLLRRFPHIAVRLLGEHPAGDEAPVGASGWVLLPPLQLQPPPGHPPPRTQGEARCGLWIRAPAGRSLHSRRCRSEAAGAAGALSGARGWERECGEAGLARAPPSPRNTYSSSSLLASHSRFTTAVRCDFHRRRGNRLCSDVIAGGLERERMKARDLPLDARLRRRAGPEC